MSVGQQPARSLGDGGKENQEEQSGHGHDTEHPTPSNVFVHNFADDCIRGVGQENAEDDIELDQTHQASAHAGRRNFSGIDRCDHRRQADTDAPEEAEQHEEGNRERGRGHKLTALDRIECRNRRQGGCQGADAKENTNPEEDRFTTKAVGEFTGDDGTADRADGCDGNDHALTHGGESVQLGEFFFRTGNDRRVKAEEQAAERGNDGASNDQRRNRRGLC